MTSKKPKQYPVAIVGESFYREAVKATKVGDYVDIFVEIDNPKSSSGTAVRVDNMEGSTIGYISEDSWVYKAIVDENRGALARVLSKGGKPTGITLELQLSDVPPEKISFGQVPNSAQQSKKSGCMGVLAFGFICAGLVQALNSIVA